MKLWYVAWNSVISGGGTLILIETRCVWFLVKRNFAEKLWIVRLTAGSCVDLAWLVPGQAASNARSPSTVRSPCAARAHSPSFSLVSSRHLTVNRTWARGTPRLCCGENCVFCVETETVNIIFWAASQHSGMMMITVICQQWLRLTSSRGSDRGETVISLESQSDNQSELRSLSFVCHQLRLLLSAKTDEGHTIDCFEINLIFCWE